MRKQRKEMMIKVKLIENIEVANPISWLLLDLSHSDLGLMYVRICDCVSFQGRLLLSNN